MKKRIVLATAVMFFATFLVMAFCVFMLGKPHRDYLSFVEDLRENKREFPDARVVLSSGAETGGARVVIIEDPRMTGKLFEIFYKAPTVYVPDYRNDSGAIFPDGSYFKSFTMKVTEGKRNPGGRLYIGGREEMGIGFLIERSQDNDWFHGAWDPWPREAYWFNMFHHEWIDEAGTGAMVGADDKWRYEAFSFLLFLKETTGGVELCFSNGAWQYRLLGPNLSSPEDKALVELVELNSIREFFRRHPDLRRPLVRSNHRSISDDDPAPKDSPK